MPESVKKHIKPIDDFFQNIIQSSDDAIISKSLDGIVNSWNPAAETIFGYTAAEMIGQSMLVLFPPDRLEEENIIIEKIKRGENVVHFETERLRKDHKLIHVSVTISPIYNDKKQIIGASKIARDISERKVTEAALAISEKRFEDLYNHAPCGYHSLDQDGFIININHTELQWIGFDKEEVIGKMKFTDFCNEEGKQKFTQNYPQFIATGHIEDLEFDLISKNGITRQVSISATAIKDHEGNLVKSRSVVHDITEMKKSQSVFQLENEKNKVLLSSASDGIHILDDQGNVVEFSDSFAEMLGYNHEEARKLNVSDWDAQIEQDQLVPLVNKFMGEWHTFETKHRRKDGTVFDVEINAKGITLGCKLYLYASSRDITERKNTERRVRDSEERLALASLYNGVGIWDWDLITGELIWDESMFALYHIDRKNFSGAVDAWEKSLHPDDQGRCAEEVQASLNDKKPFDTEFRVVWPTNEVRYIKAVAKLFYDETGRPVRMLGTNIDVTERKLLEDELKKQARIDYLTGVFNRGYFMEMAVQEFNRTTRYGNNLTLLMLDVDLFKQINDTYGHKAGDTVLIKLAEISLSTFREVDCIGRLGGEEFAVLLKETCQDAAFIVAERLRESFAGIEITLEDHVKPIHFTVSIGLAALSDRDKTIDSLLKRADQALYEAKRTGRNKVCIAFD